MTSNRGGLAAPPQAGRPYPRLCPSDNGVQTGEGGVRAHHDQRAGDRAVAAQAQDNAGLQRRLPAPVSAQLTGAQDRVNQDLGNTDPAHLAAPLADIHPD